MVSEFFEGSENIGYGNRPCRKAEALSSLQDTFETSLCTNRLFPTADCPEES